MCSLVCLISNAKPHGAGAPQPTSGVLPSPLWQLHLKRTCRLAGERGAKGAAGPGSLRVGLLDSLYCMAQSVGSKGSEADKQQVLEGLKISQLAS